MMTFGSLFSGIGGIDLGLERAGMQCAWQVEIDNYAQKVLAKHWPNVTRFRDVRECGKHNLAPVDIIAGGFPCQDISDAGKQAGIEGERSGLWAEFHRIICELQPRYVIVENVAALLYRGMGRVLRDLATSGYDAQWRVFRASDFGFPHERKRLFIVAYPHSYGRFRLNPYYPQGSTRLHTTPQTSEEMVLLRDLVAQLEQRWGTSSVCREDDGIPYWLDRLGGIGNSVIPHIIEHIGCCIRYTFNSP